MRSRLIRQWLPVAAAALGTAVIGWHWWTIDSWSYVRERCDAVSINLCTVQVQSFDPVLVVLVGLTMFVLFYVLAGAATLIARRLAEN